MSSSSPTPVALWRNPSTLFGAALCAVAALAILSFLFFELLSPHTSPYLGVFTYMVLPGFLIIGVAMVFAGLIYSRRKLHREHGADRQAHYFPRIDLNLAEHRRVLAWIGGFSGVTLPVIGVLSYRGYHYTDSNEFCGKVCHEVMEPQYTAYQQSAHARVDCAECHIGEGATWYVKSKLSGVRQVFATAFDSFPRPIPPAIQELRPARETCEQCHWPTKFFGDQLVQRDHYASDEANTYTQLRMIMKTGGSDPTVGPPSGIHWHMAVGFDVDYIATDHLLQDIPWVRLTDHDTGKATVYRSDGQPASAPPPEGIQRTIDCMDCHNRPTHVFKAPDDAANRKLHADPDLASLPFAKRELVAAVTQEYDTREAGLLGSARSIRMYYDKEHPQVAAEKKELVDRLAEAASDIYHTSFFPAMNVNWRTYPNNIGHKYFNGCYRCHDGKHVDQAGNAIRNDCHLCHTFIQPIDGAADGVTIGEFRHPVPLEGVHAKLSCIQCHDGGASQPATCDGCHSATTALRTADHALLAPFGLEIDAMAYVDCESCHDVSEPLSIDAMDEMCLECHDPDDDERFDGMLGRWVESMGQSRSNAEAAIKRLEKRLSGKANAQALQWLNENRKVLDLLDKAGPMHHFEGSTKIYSEIEAGAERYSSAP